MKKRKLLKLSFTSILLLFILLLAGITKAQNRLLIEAESFENKGGWKVDQQYFDIMGSSYLLAHGMGEAVEDATTKITFPSKGKYYIWLRTKDWAPYPIGPGKFTLKIGNEYLKEFGATGEKGWKWYEGGSITIKEPADVQLVLKDLTGFAGRCDAIYFSSNKKDVPPNNLESMNSWRKKLLGLTETPETKGKYDLVVVGGGMAGICSAITASRSGLKVALIQNRPVLGGNNSSEIRVHLMGYIDRDNHYPALGRIVRELDNGDPHNANIDGEKYGDQRKESVVNFEKNIDLFLNMHAYDVEMEGDKIKAVIARHISTNQELRFEGRFFVDCTGDGSIGFKAGADCRYGRESKSETGESLARDTADTFCLGTSNMWHASKFEETSTFPETAWALHFTKDYFLDGPTSEWFWETGFDNFDALTEAEEIRDHNFRAIYGNWSYLKNNLKEKYRNYKLDWVGFIGGKRESRRLMGDYIFSEMDRDHTNSIQADAFIPTTWSIDLHYPQDENSKYFKGQEFLSKAVHKRVKPAHIPYRCLYSRNINNLFMAGRNISTTHVRFGSTRVMRTTGLMGEVVGYATSLAIKHGTDARGVYEKHLEELKSILKGE
ncbi:pyridine nucleotide-disulfide oxidoreductase [Labilibaculum filiforme]|uniref:Pyridine nucleotide-disulfide oxidoreductase n=1 Tax=Labilibaculum filiforme TaxID=1940526 RepID=A0A2N3I1T0_9BACT|nr:FAD-dependent oxidoreductase [Labilibaculum filiforme]PKQ64266.1 pyridine nucleotide-disulfide oxidoreductase [Labilibaculum filiforme]